MMPQLVSAVEGMVDGKTPYDSREQQGQSKWLSQIA